MELKDLRERLASSPEQIEFSDVIALIDEHYDFEPSAFQNGNLQNQAGENSGSCKLFAFAQLQKLSQQETLACFGAYYRDDVLSDPEGDGHQNIRNFIQSGWSGIQFESFPLKEKS